MAIRAARAPSRDAPQPRDGAHREFANDLPLERFRIIVRVARSNAARSPWEDASIATRTPFPVTHACDARRTMASLNARRNQRRKSDKASEILSGFLSSPVRVFYSILFICALEVRDFVDAMRRARNQREGANRGAIDGRRRETDDARACDR